MNSQLIFRSDGSVRTVYSEQIDLKRLGTIEIRRGSHVEPTSEGQWMADLAPVNGPTLGPFDLRSEALDAELMWLQNHWLTR